MSKNVSNSLSIGLFATCLVDLTRPSVGFATAKLLENAGCKVTVPFMQSCCGQPAYNSGDNVNAREIAKKVIKVFKDFDHVVAPSGSCVGMIKNHYPELFKSDPEWYHNAKILAEKTYELVAFLVDILELNDVTAKYKGIVTYHDSCSSLREIQVQNQPRKLIKEISGTILKEGLETETCCGFGGLFCIKYSEISSHMVNVKVDDIIATGADTLLANDLGCLINIAGRLKRRGSSIQVRHISEVLANMTDGPPIGE
mgnify:CR=1 FL=1